MIDYIMPKSRALRGMLTILDLNGVILFREQRGRKNFYAKDEGMVANRRTYVRQDLNEFINELRKKGDVAIWSTAHEKNIMLMLYQCRIDPQIFKFIWSSIDCVYQEGEYDEKNKPLVIKPLKLVWERFSEYNDTNTIIVDDSNLKMKINPSKCVVIPESFNDPDTQKSIIPLLKGIDKAFHTLQNCVDK